MTGEPGRRVFFGAMLAAAGFAAVLAGGWPLAAVAALAAGTMAFEWRRLVRGREKAAAAAPFAVGCAAVPLLVEMHGAAVLMPSAVVAAALGFAMDRRAAGESVPWHLAGAVAAGGAPAAMVSLRAAPEVGVGIALWLCLTVIATDTAAYAGGRVLGGRKLAPRISPGKTRSGTAAGLLAGAVAGAAAHELLFPAGNLALGAVSSALLAVVAVLGDLGESALKRRAGAKDSGSILPGHGGALDRFDSMAPAVFAVWLLQPAHPWVFGAEASL